MTTMIIHDQGRTRKENQVETLIENQVENHETGERTYELTYELTHPQKRIWFTEKTFAGTPLANVGGIVKVQAEGVDPDRFEEAIRELVRSNEALRLRFAEQNGMPRQSVLDGGTVEVARMDFRGEGAEKARAWAEEQFRLPMPLENSPMCAFGICLLGPDELWLLLKQHHLISDGHSMVLTVNRILDHYLLLQEGEAAASQEAPPSYSEFIRAEQEYLRSTRFEKDRRFWMEKFADLPEPTTLRPYDLYTTGTEAARYSRRVPDELFRELRQFCADHQTNLFSLLLACFYLYLYKVTAQEDLVLGTNYLNRTNAREKMTLGMFTSTIPVRMKVDPQMTFGEWLRLLSKEQAGLIRHQRYPFDLLFTELKERSSSLERLFHILVEYQAMDFVLKPGLSSQIQAFFAGAEALDLVLHIKERLETDSLHLDFDYRSEVYSREEIEQLCSRLLCLVQDAVAHPDKPLAALRLLDEQESRRVLHEFNDTARAFPEERLIHHGFEEQVRLRPHHPAVVTDSGTLTYAQLDERAGRLARRLRSAGVGPGSYVGLLLNRSDRLIEAMLGIAKAGGAYVPMEPGYPAARIERILNTLGAAHLVSESVLSPLWEQLPSACPQLANILCVDQDADASEAEERASAAEAGVPAAGPHDPAYAIFTSGSTGVPKGVIVHHRSVSNLIDWVNRTTGMGPEDRVLFVTSPTFDLSVYDVFGLLTAGGTIRLVEAEDIRRPERLLELLRDEPVTCWNSAPAALQQLAPLIESHPQPVSASLRHVLLSGDWIPLKLPGVLQRAFPGVRVLAMGGATEATVWSNVFEVGEVDPNWASIPYGRPIQNARYYILDSGLAPCPIGVPGELFIGGECLAAGYDDPALTAARFLPDPYSLREGGRMYRTGDRARWMADGNIEFLGRIDHQVKIRGYRIEPGEIQAQLAKHPAVKEAVVIDRQDAGGEKYLCAYLVTEEELTVGRLREFLGASLPEYMIPAHFVRLPAMPVTANGKLDRRSLPEPDGSIGSGTAYVAPRNEKEAKLAEIWREVLQREVGVQDDFFRLGGHSLQAAVMASRIRQEFGTDMALRTLFAARTVEGLADWLGQQRGAAAGRLPSAGLREVYPLSSAQRRLYIACQMEGTEAAYHMPGLLHLKGELDEGRLRHAFDALIRRHEALRTGFELHDGEPVQRIHDEAPFTLESDEGGAEELRKRVSSFIRPFDLTRPPLMRASLVKAAPGHGALLFDMHHLISDGVSMNVLMRELAELYADGGLPELQAEYKDYALWQQEQLQSGSLGREEAYWLEQFAGELPVLELPTDRPRPAVQSYEGARLAFRAGEGLTGRLLALTERTDTTLYMVLLAAYQVLLAKYSGQEDVIVGSPVAGRPHADLQGVLGMFVNMICLRARPEPDKRFSDFLQEVKARSLDAFEYENYPFEELVRRLEIRKEASRSPLFDTVFALQNLDVEGLERGGVRFLPEPVDSGTAKFDLLLEAYPGKEELAFSLEYRSRLFDAATMERFAGHYLHLLEQLTENSHMKLSELSLVTAAEEAALRDYGTGAHVEGIHERTITAIFENVVSAAPDRFALSHGGERLTYRELDERASRLARTLIGCGVGPGSPVGLMAKRSVGLMVGILGILKAGGAYVPLDPNYPEDRLAYMLEDSGAEVLLTQSGLESPGGYQGRVLHLEDPALYETEASRLPERCLPEHLAYVIYTSGTTGKPKGNMTTHANLGRLVHDMTTMGLHSGDKMLQLSNAVFDGSVIDIFGALMNGAELVLAEEDTATDMALLADCIEKRGITVFFLTTALLNTLIDERPECLRGVRKVLFGGEKASVPHVRKALELLGPGRLVNCYGPTETTVFVTVHEVTELPEDAAALPIGRPVANTRLYIVDKHDRLQPVGVPGELCIAGQGVSRGYLNRPDLTDAKFVTCPFEPGGLMYRTGDLARWRPDGRVEYIDRMDQQVKIRGFRIELGEVENRLLELEAVKEAVVTAGREEGGSAYLCAYVVSDETWTAAGLRAALGRSLPDYMIPRYFVTVERIPLTASGKVDRKALPEPDAAAALSADYTAPSDGVEKVLAGIWESLLGIERIGIHDHFFHLGGDSIKAIQAASRMLQCGYKVGTREFLAYPTIAELAPHVQTVKRHAPQEPVEGEVPLGPVQRWFFERGFTDRHHFNQSVLLYSQTGWQEEPLRRTLSRLTEHHDALRMVFGQGEDGVRQFNRGPAGGSEDTVFKLEVIRSASVQAAREAVRCQADEVQGSLDLGEGPLFRARLFEAGEEGAYLLLVIHHLVVDGVSWRILLEDLAAGYEQAVQGQTPAFGSKTDAYQAWTRRLTAYADSEALREELFFWKGQKDRAAGLPPLLPPCPEPARDTAAEAGICTVSLTEEETEDLLQRTHQVYRTEINDLLLAALALALREWTGSGRSLILLEGHGREALFPELDISRTVGWFTSQYPVLLEVDGPRHPVIAVKEQLRAVPSKGVGYGVLRYLAADSAGLQEAIGLEPEISFNYLGRMDEETGAGFVLSEEPMGEQISPKAERISGIGINAMIRQGRLTAKIDYLPLTCSGDRIQHLAEAYRRHLLELIDHCVNKRESELTGSDVSSSQVTQEDLEDLFSLLG
ncbi:non-ribosomal peptide synthetase [Paenibacillus mucilaginosus]|uniref:non-ribosomal peptide synthetase n=1 Tax=Paenibacillus mucilaginosus TaxID=61624 RepID=UPI001EF138E4|nr:non-ribosomal peptide synthetase [Paenibacillus mucilaginosus]MCG7211877.1 amino acid adenylation domain-containing protein [Paenibacillus mucilaginosus]WDM25122.1 amino acid adenylation domain-containing protein [Paenibacillus mucilaginosus]